MMPGRIAEMLDRAGLPWRTPRGELAARKGITRCRISHDDIVEADGTSPLLPSPLAPLAFRVSPDFDPRMPPTSLYGWSWSSADAMGNLKLANTALERWLGPGERYDSANTRGFEWVDGRASVRLICFPPRLQDFHGDNAWEEREPRLATAASIWIESGFLPLCSFIEREWIAEFERQFRISEVPLSQILQPEEATKSPPRSVLARLFGRPEPAPAPQPAPLDVQAWVAKNRVPEILLEFSREPPPDIDRLYGWATKSADATSLIFCTQNLWIVPLDGIAAIDLSRIHPGRGPGHSLVELCCGENEKRLAVSHGTTPDDCDDKAERFARWLGVPLRTSDSVDC